MKKLQIKLPVLLLIFLVFGTSCKKEEEKPTKGKIEGYVRDLNTNTAISEVRVIVFNANTNSPTGESIMTDSEGFYQIELEPETYYLKLYKLGYEDIPARGISPLPISVEVGATNYNDFDMVPSSITDGSIISGVVNPGETPEGGVLVVAENGDHAFSTVSDAKGNYYIYNVPAGNYEVKGWKAGFNSTVQSITVQQSSEIADVNLELTGDATATVSGTITFLATGNSEVDVSLVHPITKETIPGLSTKTVGASYTLPNVPDGTYIGRASFENDSIVMDPDWIVKNGGEPEAVVAGANLTLDFSVTGAVNLLSPTNPSESVQPVEVRLDTLRFTWEQYPSSSDYVIEVINSSGIVIWGGFSSDWSQKNIAIPSSQTSVEYNFDASASDDLEIGKTYRWRIYASKDDNSVSGWRLISASEEQMGLIKIIE